MLTVAQARRVLRELVLLWESMTGQPIGALDQDLERLSDWFHPKREPRTMIRLMQSAPTQAIGDDVDPCYFAYLGEHVLITPEGRLAIERLRHAVDVGAPVARRPDHGETVPLLLLYRDWSRYRFDAFAAKLEGRSDQPLVAVGAALLTAACGWTSEECAVAVPADSNDDVAVALRRCVEKFADALGGEPRARERRTAHFDGYPTQKAETRLAGAMIRRRQRGGPMRIWLDGEKVDWTLDRCAEDLARRRPPVPSATALRAVEAMLDSVDVHSAVFDDAGVLRPTRAARRAFTARVAEVFAGDAVSG